MEISKVIPIEQNQIQPEKEGLVLPADELKKLTDFFFILIQIDKRANITKTYGKPNK